MRKTKAQIQEINEELEQRVAERTKELIATNNELRREIAERKHAEDELRRSEDRIRLIIDTIPIEAWTVRPDGIVDFYNQRWLDYAGEGAIEDPYGIVHPEDLPGVMEKWLEKMAAEEPSESEMRIRRADGEYRWFLVRTAPLRDERGKLVKWYGVSIDIEDRKQAEDALRRSEERLRLVIDTIPTMAWSLRPDGVADFLNQRWMDYAGLSLEEYVKAPTGPVHPEDIPRVMEKWLRDMAAGEPNEDEIRLRRADGEYRWFLVRNSPLRDEQGRIIKWYGVSIDIEDRKQAEEKLRQSESQLVEGQRLAHVGSWDWDLRSNNVTWSDELYRIFGLQPGEIDPAYETMLFIHPEDHDLVLSTIQDAIKNKNSYSFYYRVVRPDGNERIVHSRGHIVIDEDGVPIRAFGATQDVTESKRAEDELRLAYQRLSFHIENSPLAFIEWDRQGHAKSWSKRAEEIFGWTAKEFIESGKTGIRDVVYEEDLPMVTKIAEELTTGTLKRNNVQHRNLTKDGKIIWCEWFNSVLTDDRGVVTIMSLVQDITERKNAEEQKEFEQREKEALINTTDDLIWSVSPDFKLIAANKAFIRRMEELTGVTFMSGDDLLIPEVFPEDILAYWKEAYKRALSGETFKKEIYSPAFDKFAERWEEICFNPIYIEDIVVALACYSRDITTHKKAEEQKEFEQRDKEALINSTEDMIWSVSKDFKLIAVNRAFVRGLEALTGVTAKPGDDILMPGFFPADIVALWKDAYSRALAGETFKIEIYVPATNSLAEGWSETSFNPIYKDGTVVGLACYSRNITEKKLAGERQSLFTAIVNSSEDAIISKTLDGIITSWNRGAEKIFGHTQKEVVGKHITILIPTERRMEEEDIITRIKRGESVENFETERVKKDGGRIYISLTVSPILDSNGIIVGASKIARDITERKKTEEELHQLNEELRSLSSHLQNIREEERIQIARDIHDELGQKLTGLKMDVNWLNRKLGMEDEIVKQKIHSINELMDETLKSVRKISSDLRPSLLDNIGLIAALEWHSEEMARRSEIKVNFSADIPEPNIPPAKVTSIFRIYQELLTNAVRHANARVINSSLRLHDNHLILEIKDDGQGMDPAIIAAKKTLGLIGIKERTFAMGGKYDLKSELGKGTEVKISIPL